MDAIVSSEQYRGLLMERWHSDDWYRRLAGYLGVDPNALKSATITLHVDQRVNMSKREHIERI